VRNFSLAPVRRAHLVRAAAAVCLVMGYADLSRGGVNVAPILLFIGYMLLVPAVILTWR
jgi:hypothetical protein